MRKQQFLHFVLLVLSINSLIAKSKEESVLRNIDLNIFFETYFDNRENANTEELQFRSGTDFAAKLAPTISYNFYGAYSLVGGLSWVIPFGNMDNKSGLLADPYYEELLPIIYYKVKSKEWSAAMGLFPYSETMIGSYSTAFFSDDYLFYENVVTGLMGRYNWAENTYLEFICWWQSQPDECKREIFKLLSSANVELQSGLYGGYAFALTHYAGSETEGVANVVDNGLFNPYVGYKREGEYLLDTRVGCLVSMQRDRGFENEWLYPAMLEAGFSLSRWSITFDERFYCGEDLMPLYGGHTDLYYADALYTGDPMFRANGVYNRAELKFEQQIANGKVVFDVGFVTHLFEGRFNTEQRFSLRVYL